MFTKAVSLRRPFSCAALSGKRSCGWGFWDWCSVFATALRFQISAGLRASPRFGSATDNCNRFTAFSGRQELRCRCPESTLMNANPFTAGPSLPSAFALPNRGLARSPAELTRNPQPATTASADGRVCGWLIRVPACGWSVRSSAGCRRACRGCSCCGAPKVRFGSRFG